MKINEDWVRAALRPVVDPEFGVSIVDMNMVRSIRVDDGAVHIELVLTVPFCPLAAYIAEMARQAVAALPGVEQVTVDVLDEPWRPPGQDNAWD